MLKPKLKGLIQSGLLFCSIFFLAGFDYSNVKNVKPKAKPGGASQKDVGAAIKKVPQAPKVSTELNLPADAFKGFYYVEPMVWGGTIYLAVVKRKVLSANFMNSCDYVIYEGDPSDAFGTEVGDFIKSKRDWTPIDGSISVLSKGHFDICRKLFQQPTVSDLCVSANLGMGMAGAQGGGFGGYNFPDLFGGGAGKRGSERFGDAGLSQGGAGGGRPSVGDLFNAGGDGGAGSFLHNYDPCSNQNCAASGGASQGSKGFSGLGSSISGFGRKTLAVGGSESGGLGHGDPRMMEGGLAPDRRYNQPEEPPNRYPMLSSKVEILNLSIKWKVNSETGDAQFQYTTNPGRWDSETFETSCNLSDPKCQAQASDAAEIRAEQQRGIAEASKPQPAECQNNSNDPKCKPKGGESYPACDVPGQTGCNDEFTAFIPIAKVKEFLESGGKKGQVSYPLPEGGVPLPVAPGEVPTMDPLAPLINPVPDEVGGSTTFASNSTPCGSAVQDIMTGIGGGSKPTKGTLLNCPEGTFPGPQGCRPIVDTGGPGGGGGNCPPGKPGCGPTD